jgi:flagellar biosynthetic protein FliR
VLPIFGFKEAEMIAFALVLIRISVFVAIWPVFSVYSVPNLLKVLFALCLALMLFPVINKSGLTNQMIAQDLVWLAGKEVLTGLCLGFLTRLFFFAVSVGGNIIATEVGLANAQMFNPAMNATTTTVEQFYTTVATLLFLALDGHHFFLTGLVQSFDAIPLAAPGINLAHHINSGVVNSSTLVAADGGVIIQTVIEAGIKMAAPVMFAIFIMNIAMGIIGRAVPQINVLITSMSVNFLAGLIVMIIAIPALMFQLDHDLVMFADQLFKFMKAM